MNNNTKPHSSGFYDSVCTCRKCKHNMAKECFKLKCICCNISEHSMIMDGFEGFEKKECS
jgi:hypothetical protein